MFILNEFVWRFFVSKNESARKRKRNEKIGSVMKYMEWVHIQCNYTFSLKSKNNNIEQKFLNECYVGDRNSDSTQLQTNVGLLQNAAPPQSHFSVLVLYDWTFFLNIFDVKFIFICVEMLTCFIFLALTY